MSEPVLEAQSLSVQRGGLSVLQEVCFSVEQGEVFALLGGNGAGKSTTLLTFLGLLEPSSGKAMAFGKAVHDDATRVQRQTAYVPETASLYPHLCARENVTYFLSLAGVKRSAKDIETAFDDVNLSVEARGRRLESYSKGMRQKVAISLAILRRVPVMMLDEPTSGLDPVAIDEFHRLISSLAAGGTTIMMVTHDVYGACHVAKRVGLLRRGELVGLYEATADRPISADTVHQAFAESHA